MAQGVTGGGGVSKQLVTAAESAESADQWVEEEEKGYCCNMVENSEKLPKFINYINKNLLCFGKCWQFKKTL